jgi:hypothetical protein
MLQVFMTPWRGGTPPIFALLDEEPGAPPACTGFFPSLGGHHTLAASTPWLTLISKNRRYCFIGARVLPTRSRPSSSDGKRAPGSSRMSAGSAPLAKIPKLSIKFFVPFASALDLNCGAG